MKVIVLLLLCTFVFAHRHHGGANDQDKNVKQCRLCVAEADGEYQWCPHTPTTHNDYDGKCIKSDESCPTTLELPIYTPSQCAGDNVELKTSCSECLADGYTWCADDLTDDMSGSCVAIDSIVVPDRRRHGVDSSTGHHFNGGGGWPRGGHQKHEGEGDAEGNGNGKRRRPHSVDDNLSGQPDAPPVTPVPVTPVPPVAPGLPPRPSPPRHDRDGDQSEDGEGSSGKSDSSDSSEDGDWDDHRDGHDDREGDHGRGRPPRGVFPPRPGFPEHPEHPEEPGHPTPFPDGGRNRDGWRHRRGPGRDTDGSTGSDEARPDHGHSRGSEEEGRGEREGQHRRGGWWRHGSTGATDGRRGDHGHRHRHDGDRDHDRNGERDPVMPPFVSPISPVPVPVPIPLPSPPAEPTPVVIAPIDDSTGVADADNSATGPLAIGGSDSSVPSVPAYQASTGSATGSRNTKRGMCVKRGQQLIGRLDQCPSIARVGVHPVRDHDDGRHHDHEHGWMTRRHLLIWVVIPVTLLLMCCAVCCIRRRCRRMRAIRASKCVHGTTAAAEGTVENNNNDNGNGNGSNNGSDNGNGNLSNNGNNNGSNNSVTVNLPSVTTINVSRPVYAVSPSHISSSLLRQPLIQSAPEEIPSEDQGAQEEQQQQEMALALEESEGQLPTELGDDGLAMPSEAVLMLDDAVINSSEMEGEVEERKPGFLSRLLSKVKRSPYQPVQ